MKAIHTPSRPPACFVGLLLLACTVSCQEAERPAQGPAQPAGLETVYVVNYPLKYMAERIAGGSVQIVLPTPADEDPAYWMPTSETIGAYQRADLVLLNGAGYAGWVSKVSLRDSRLVDTSAAFADRYIALDDDLLHSHGPEGEHSHKGMNFNTWLDPALAMLQAKKITEAFSAAAPERAASFEENFKTLQADLEALDTMLKEITAKSDRAPPLVASHPVYDYLTRRYGWNVKSMHWEPDEMPDESQWADLQALLAEHPARSILWEAPPQEAIVGRLAKLGLTCVVFYPCGNVPEDGDYLEVMRDNAERLRSVFQSRRVRAKSPTRQSKTDPMESIAAANLLQVDARKRPGLGFRGGQKCRCDPPLEML